MLKYFKLLRVQNLLFIVLMQWMIIHFILSPILRLNDINNSDSLVFYILLIATTMLIAAGGYVLNDYFDVKIDAINKPEKQLIGKSIQRKNAMLLYQGLTISGILTGFILSWLLKNLTLSLVFVAVPGLLWFYSASYKRQLIIGNVIIAFIAGLSVFIVGMTQTIILHGKYGLLIFETEIPKQIYTWIGGFAFFTFLLTWVREIIKDMEDIVGDSELECRTMPIVWGILKTKIVIWGLIIIIATSLITIEFLFIPFGGSLSIRYIVTGIIIPLALLAYLIYKAKLPKDYHQASSLSKFIMLIGILYTLIFNYSLAKEAGISFFNNFIT